MVRLGLLLLLLYIFFVSIALMGDSFAFFGGGFAAQLLTTTANPFIGLFIGILATSLVQSSSTTTSMTVGLVAAGALTVDGAIPIAIGANIGTSVTNSLVSLGHISRPVEFRRAFAAATVHDFYNLLAVVLLFPLEMTTHFMARTAAFLGRRLAAVGGLELANPVNLIVDPATGLITALAGESGAIMLAISIAFLFIALRYIVANLKVLVIGRVEVFFSTVLFRNSFPGFGVRVGPDDHGTEQFDHNVIGRPARRRGTLDVAADLPIHARRQPWNDDHRNAGRLGDGR